MSECGERHSDPALWATQAPCTKSKGHDAETGHYWPAWEEVCTSCIASIECTDDVPGCNYPEPHDHSFACDKTCAYCQGQGVRVKDPENHPHHVEWRTQ